MTPLQTKRLRTLRRCLVGLAVCLTLIALFYTEENWRGKRAWENCKHALEAQGVKMDWAAYIPAPVPEDQNVFGVPEMQKWFVGRGSTELSRKLSYLGYRNTNTPRLVVGELTIDLPGAITLTDSRATTLKWSAPRAQAEAARLIRDALGPVAMDPVGINYMLRSPEEIRPAQIVLECQTKPTEKELLQFLPSPIANTEMPGYEKIQVEPVGHSSYKMTMCAPDTVAEYLKWSETLEPEFTLIREALQRPYTRMNGNYSEPVERPIPNFVGMRSISQTMVAMAQCHLVEGKPEEALRDLTLLHDLCRILEDDHPVFLVSAMLNVAVRGLYVNTIADGLRWQAWHEPQLAALEDQLQQISFLPLVKQGLEMDRVSVCHFLESAPRARVVKTLFSAPVGHYKTEEWTAWKNSVFASWIPRGCFRQNMVAVASLFSGGIAGLDPARQIVFPDKLNAATAEAQAVSSHSSPYTFLAAEVVPNYSKAIQVTARNQTTVNQALIACALERYRLAHGEYPETLGALVPQFITTLPHDVIGGQPLHYRRAADGTFLLYSIGWNGKDGGGVPGKTYADGDWVWPIF